LLGLTGVRWRQLALSRVHRAACAASITPVGAWFLLLGRLVECGRGPSSNGSDLSKRKFRLVYRSEDIEGSLPALIPTSTQFRYCVTVTGVEIGFESGSAPPAGYGVSRNGLREPGGDPLKLTPLQ
jgi:hypothetical protein